MKNIFASTIYAGGAHPVEDSDIDDAISYIESEIIVKSETIPEASESYYKAVYQYIGETDSTYTHGYIYECKKSDNSTVVFTPSIIECSGEDFTTFLEDVGSGYDYDSVVAGTMEYAQDADLWIFTGKNSNDETVFTYQQYTQDFIDAGFTFTGTYEDGDIVAFERTVAYTYEWARLDVQPDSTDLTNYYTKTEADNLLENKANKATTLAGYGITDGANTALSNLSTDGQMVIDSQNGTISNCILEIPQNIKVDVDNINGLVLKSGSKVYVPNGFETDGTTPKFDEVVTTTNIQIQPFSFSDVSTRVAIISTNLMTFDYRFLPSDCYSGDTEPTGVSTNALWYDTANNIIKRTTDGGTTWDTYRKICLPFCIFTRNSTTQSITIDKVFNGAGFIGHHIFVFPDVMGYASNGINVDGSLASVNIKNNALRIIEMTSSTTLPHEIAIQTNKTLVNWSAYKEVIHDSDADYTQANVRYYIRDLNLVKMYRNEEISVVDGLPIVSYFYTGANVTDFTPRQCVKIATVEMLDKALGDIDTALSAIIGA